MLCPVIYVGHLQDMDILHDGPVPRMLCDATWVACLTKSFENSALFLAAVSVGRILLGWAFTTLAPAIMIIIEQTILHVTIFEAVCK